MDSPREMLWQRRVPPVKRRKKLWVLRGRLKSAHGHFRGAFVGYMRGKFFIRVHGRLPRRPSMHLDRSPEDQYDY